MSRRTVFSPILLLISLAACDSDYVVSEVQSPELPVAAREVCAVDEVRECRDGAGTQFCDEIDGELTWGPCLIEFVCQPGIEECVFGDVAECVLIDGIPTGHNCDFTPLVLSFEPGARIELASSDAGFDIAGVGECLDSDWPSAATPWLAADLDRNGSIDAGHELFGSGTRLASGGHARNGFVALEPFDGNHDGRISAADARFDELLVWRDEDGDKRSSAFELSTLTEAGVRAIELSHVVFELCDARGNCGRERSRFEYVGPAGQLGVGEVVDIHLACP